MFVEFVDSLDSLQCGTGLANKRIQMDPARVAPMSAYTRRRLSRRRLHLELARLSRLQVSVADAPLSRSSDHRTTLEPRDPARSQVALMLVVKWHILVLSVTGATVGDGFMRHQFPQGCRRRPFQAAIKRLISDGGSAAAGPGAFDADCESRRHSHDGLMVPE